MCDYFDGQLVSSCPTDYCDSEIDEDGWEIFYYCYGDLTPACMMSDEYGAYCAEGEDIPLEACEMMGGVALNSCPPGYCDSEEDGGSVEYWYGDMCYDYDYYNAKSLKRPLKRSLKNPLKLLKRP